ncbi:MAG: hypothetical protein K5707_08275 [Clostridia bacterium]|nr:hypothetical protein [Clostridia bacterium]
MKKYIDPEGVMRACYDSFLKTGNKAYREIFALMEAVPAADVQEVRHGKKKVYYHGENRFSYECDQCAMPIDGKDAFCRWCGAKMEVEE